MNKEIIVDCYDKSIKILKKNSTKFGVLACDLQPKATERNYLSVFSRDASICSLGMIASKNKSLVKIAKDSLLTLARYQAPNGEIPNYIKPEQKYSDFWFLGSKDATLWWLIAIDFYNKNTKDKSLKRNLKKNIIRALNWLSAQEHNKFFLISQPEASDWADLMPRNGFVLYTNTLWYKVKSLYKLYEKDLTYKYFNILLSPHKNYKKDFPQAYKKIIEDILKHKNPGDHYLSFNSYRYWGEDIDVFGNSLAILADLTNITVARRIIKEIRSEKIIPNFPVPVTINPIKENSKLWRNYMKTHRQNYPYQYHNGGTWPFASCFFAMSQKKSHLKKESLLELEKIAKLNAANNWCFSEWFHSKTGQAHGMKGQSWNAGAFILAYHYINNDIDF